MDSHHDQHSAPCTFCELIHGSAEVSICHEDADAIAFMDIQPVNNGHVLVVPREHHESLLDVPEELGVHLFKVTMRLANAVRQVTGCDDMNIVVNSGAAAGQDEPHYHVHIIPRRAGDGFDIPLPFGGSEMPDRTVLEAYAAQIIAALRDPMRTSGDRGAKSSGKSATQSDAQHADSSSEQGDARAPQSQPAAQRASDAALSDEHSAPAWRGERVVDMPVFDEANRSPAGARLGFPRHVTENLLLHADEGAHGELRYQPSLDDAPA